MPRRYLEKTVGRRLVAEAVPPSQISLGGVQEGEPYCRTRSVTVFGATITYEVERFDGGMNVRPISITGVPLQELSTGGEVSLRSAWRSEDLDNDAVEMMGGSSSFGIKRTFDETRVQVRECFAAPTVALDLDSDRQSGQSAEWEVDKREGWNAGARSIERLEGDIHLSFRAHPAVRAAVGLARRRQTNHYRELEFGFRFVNNNFAFIHEKGAEVSGPHMFKRTDRWSISRVGSEVIYRRNGTEIHRSQTDVLGSLIVVAPMYMGGDRVI